MSRPSRVSPLTVKGAHALQRRQLDCSRGSPARGSRGRSAPRWTSAPGSTGAERRGWIRREGVKPTCPCAQARFWLDLRLDVRCAWHSRRRDSDGPSVWLTQPNAALVPSDIPQTKAGVALPPPFERIVDPEVVLRRPGDRCWRHPRRRLLDQAPSSRSYAWPHSTRHRSS